MHNLRVGFLSSHNYLDKNAWSGILYYMQKASKQRDLQVIYLGEPKKYSRWQKLLSYERKNNIAPKKGYLHYISEYTKFASNVERQLVKTL